MTSEFRFSADELTVLAQLLGADEFPGLGTTSFTPYSTETRAIAGRAARRGLLARGVITVEPDGTIEVAPEHRRLIERALNPALIVTLEVHNSGEADTRRFYADPTLMVEHRGLLGGVSELREYSTGSLLEVLLESSNLTVRPESDAMPLTTTFSALGSLRRSDSDHEQELPEDHPLVEAVGAGCAMNVISTMYAKGDTVTGDWIAWFDAEGAGLWQIEMDAEVGDTEAGLLIRSVPTDGLIGAIMGGLPGIDDSPDA